MVITSKGQRILRIKRLSPPLREASAKNFEPLLPPIRKDNIKIEEGKRNDLEKATQICRPSPVLKNLLQCDGETLRRALAFSVPIAVCFVV